MWIQLHLTSKIRLQFPVVVCKDLKAGILVSLQQQQKWSLVLDLPKMQATFKNIGITFNDISFGTSMCLDLMSWVQEVHNAAIMMVLVA